MQKNYTNYTLDHRQRDPFCGCTGSQNQNVILAPASHKDPETNGGNNATEQ